MRLRLDPDTKMLGNHERVSSRRGRPISQEEIAEAAGVSRCWYAQLESGMPINPSVPLLDRLAGALNATPRERAMLFGLAIPELGSILIPATRRRHCRISISRRCNQSGFSGVRPY
jgi:transcriptional regulator with XRE-family HTH domain